MILSYQVPWFAWLSVLDAYGPPSDLKTKVSSYFSLGTHPLLESCVKNRIPSCYFVWFRGSFSQRVKGRSTNSHQLTRSKRRVVLCYFVWFRGSFSQWVRGRSTNSHQLTRSKRRVVLCYFVWFRGSFSQRVKDDP
jgi:hypothetical protein